MKDRHLKDLLLQYLQLAGEQELKRTKMQKIEQELGLSGEDILAQARSIVLSPALEGAEEKH